MVAEPSFDPEAILRALNRHAVGYVVVGGFAVAAHGVVRATADLDLVVERTWENAERLARALAEVEATDATGGGTPVTREVLVRRADRRFRTAFGEVHLLDAVADAPDYRALLPPVTILLSGESIPVASLERLRAIKRSAGRVRDRADLAELDHLDGAEPPR